VSGYPPPMVTIVRCLEMALECAGSIHADENLIAKPHASNRAPDLQLLVVVGHETATFHRWRSSAAAASGRDWHGDEKIAGEQIGVQVSQRGRTPQFGGSNPSIRLIPVPAGRGKAV
jgi:hypothetical protein